MAILTAKCAACETSALTPGELVKCEECGDMVCEACIVRSEDEEGNKTVLCQDCDVNVYDGEEEEEDDEDSDDDSDDDEDSGEDSDDEDDDEELEIGVDDEDDDRT